MERISTPNPDIMSKIDYQQFSLSHWLPHNPEIVSLAPKEYPKKESVSYSVRAVYLTQPIQTILDFAYREMQIHCKSSQKNQPAEVQIKRVFK